MLLEIQRVKYGLRKVVNEVIRWLELADDRTWECMCGRLKVAGTSRRLDLEI